MPYMDEPCPMCGGHDTTIYRGVGEDRVQCDECGFCVSLDPRVAWSDRADTHKSEADRPAPGRPPKDG